MLGNGRLEALCFDGSKRLANVREHREPAGATMRHALCVSFFGIAIRQRATRSISYDATPAG